MLCTALVLLARRIPLIHYRDFRLYLSGIVTCAIVLWIGPLPAAAGAIAACFIDARMFQRDRSSRISTLKSGLGVASAAAAAGIAVHFAPANSSSHTQVMQICVLAWQQACIPVLVYASVQGLSVLAFEPTSSESPRQARITANRARLAAAFTGYSALAITIPAATVLGAWAMLPFGALLCVFGFAARRAIEVTNLRKQLVVSQAMGLAGLADAATAEPTALLYRFLQFSESLVHADRGLVWMVDDATGDIIPAVGLPDMGEFAGLRSRLGEGLIGAAAERTRPMIVSDAARSLRRGDNEPASNSWLLYPIVSKNRVLGVAHWTRPSSAPFTQDDAAQLEGLVPHVGVAVESLRSRNKMREQAATDGLTGLYNRAKISELLKDEMRRSARYNRPLSILMLDLDGFKSFNDAYGHPKGDDMLRGVANLLREGVRTVDSVGRYGGEEFIIVMPETHKDDAFLLAERIRFSIEQRAFVVISGEEIHRTISAGVASYPEDGLNPHELIVRADEALYRAKNAGRNCVIWA